MIQPAFTHQHEEFRDHFRKLLLTITQPSIIGQELLALLPPHLKYIFHFFLLPLSLVNSRSYILISQTFPLPLLLVFLLPFTFLEMSLFTFTDIKLWKHKYWLCNTLHKNASMAYKCLEGEYSLYPIEIPKIQLFPVFISFVSCQTSILLFYSQLHSSTVTSDSVKSCDFSCF